ADTRPMLNRVGWAVFLLGLGVSAAGLFAYPWLRSGRWQCNAVAGGQCTISDGNTWLVLTLLIAAIAMGSLRVWRPTSRSAADLVVAAAGFGIGFAVFAQDYDHFEWQPELHVSAASGLPAIGDLPSDWSPT